MSVHIVTGDTFTERPVEWSLNHSAQPAEPPWYGPVCPVVWEGSRREAGPYPDFDWVIVQEDLYVVLSNRRSSKILATAATADDGLRGVQPGIVRRKIRNSTLPLWILPLFVQRR